MINGLILRLKSYYDFLSRGAVDVEKFSSSQRSQEGSLPLDTTWATGAIFGYEHVCTVLPVQ